MRQVPFSTMNGRAVSVSWHGDDDELLDVKQAAVLLTVRPSTLAAWAREGRVPMIRLGPRATRWTRPLLRQIVAERLEGGASERREEGWPRGSSGSPI